MGTGTGKENVLVHSVRTNFNAGVGKFVVRTGLCTSGNFKNIVRLGKISNLFALGKQIWECGGGRM